MGDRQLIARRPDVLVYTGSELATDLEITGPIVAHLHVASTATDTDFTVALVDVFPDGRANLIQDGILRATYRNGTGSLALLKPGQPYEVSIDLWSTSYRVEAGHRLRVEVSSSCFNRYDRNPNTGEPFGTARTSIVASQTVYHDRARPSRVVLPVRSIHQ